MYSANGAWGLLPPEIWARIFEYDPTYRERYRAVMRQFLRLQTRLIANFFMKTGKWHRTANSPQQSVEIYDHAWRFTSTDEGDEESYTFCWEHRRIKQGGFSDCAAKTWVDGEKMGVSIRTFHEETGARTSRLVYIPRPEWFRGFSVAERLNMPWVCDDNWPMYL